MQVLQERVQETFWLVGTIETNSKLSFEQMFANSFLWYLHSSDLSFISSADSFLCSDTSLASWNLWIFPCGIFQGNPGESQPLADKKRRSGEVLVLSSADEPHPKGPLLVVFLPKAVLNPS